MIRVNEWTTLTDEGRRRIWKLPAESSALPASACAEKSGDGTTLAVRSHGRRSTSTAPPGPLSPGSLDNGDEILLSRLTEREPVVGDALLDPVDAGLIRTQLVGHDFTHHLVRPWIDPVRRQPGSVSLWVHPVVASA